MSSKFEEVIALREQLTAKLQTFGQEAFTEGLAPIFAANPHIEGIIWEQYTPYFNDGDACEFSVKRPAIILSEQVARIVRSGEEWDEYEENDDYGYGSMRRFDNWDLRETEFNFEKIGLEAVWDRIPEEIFEAVFGDHVQVRIMRDGTVTVEGYEHD